jgi:hypothetical protein
LLLSSSLHTYHCQYPCSFTFTAATYN